MQEYKSRKNAELDRKLARQQEKQKGEVTFELVPNFSGRITTLFTKEYKILPFIAHTLLVDKDHAFDVQCALTQLTLKDFTIDIQNLSAENIKGTILWHAE